MQDNHVVFYESRKLKDRENNYATHDFEFAACCAPTQQPLKNIISSNKIVFYFWWNVWISYSKLKELKTTEMVTF